MVYRRIHRDNMHKLYQNEATDRLYNNILAVPARIMESAKIQNADDIVLACKKTMGVEFCHQIAATDKWHPKSITLDEFENALSRFSLMRTMSSADTSPVTYTPSKQEASKPVSPPAVEAKRALATADFMASTS